MREKIVELAKEVWEYNQLSLEIPAQDLQIEAEAGSSVCGVFHIQNTEGKMMKGRAYVRGNTLLQLTKAEFSGIDCQVAYEFCAEGLLCGEAQKCTIEVYSDCGYLAAACKVQVILPYVDSSIGHLDDLMRFTELCRKDWKEALQIFRSADFERVFLQDQERMKTIYHGLLRGEGKSNALEEFLVAARRKKPVHLSAKKNHLTFSKIRQEQEEIIVLKRSSWGYGKYSVVSDSAFLRPDRNLLWADAFTGDEYSLGVMILPQHLHNGKNIGKITLSSVTEQVEITIEIMEELTEEKKTYLRKCRHKKETMLQLLKGFRGFLIGFLKGTMYVNRQNNLLRESVVPFSADRKELFQIHFVQVQGKWEDAQEMLRKLQLSGEPAMIFGQHCREDMEKGITLDRERILSYAAFLYFGVLLYDKEGLDERAVSLKYLDALRKQYPDLDFVLYLYILAAMSTISENAVKPKDREALAEYLLLLRGRAEKNKERCDSSFLYVIACHIWNRRPDMLTRLDAFSIPALFTGIRYKMLSKSLKSQFLYLAGSTDGFHRLVFCSLCRMYKESSSDEVLSSMLKHLIRGQQAGENYHPYFRKGIEQRLRITQLYEYFIYSMREDDMEPLPLQVLIYFQYSCSLPDSKKAALFANIVCNRKNDMQSYLNYQSQMERFALEQVARHKISRNLSVLYADLLNSTNMDSVLERHLAQIIFRHEIICHQPEMQGIYILYEELEREEYVPLKAGKALANLITEHAVLLFEDKDGGRHYYIDFTADRLFRMDELSEKCLESGGPQPGQEVSLKTATEEKDLFILSLIKKAGQRKSPGNTGLYAMEYALFMQEFSVKTKGRLWMSLLEYYYDNFHEEKLRELLKLNIPVEISYRKRLLEIYIAANEMQKAYELLCEGMARGILQQISIEKLSLLLNWCLDNRTDAPEEKKILFQACYRLFRKGAADKRQMAFLMRNIEGTAGEMLAIWNSPQAKLEELIKERCLLAGAILIHVLFARMELSGFEEVFEGYYKSRESFKYTEHYHLTELVVRAFLFVYASRYLHDQETENPAVFAIMFQELHHARMQACRYALLKYYSGAAFARSANLNGGDVLSGAPEGARDSKYTKEQLSWIETNAKECIEECMVFPFFRNFGEEVRLPSGVRNSCYVSYTASPSSIVTLHYCYRNAKNQGEYESQVMKNRFQGIYVRSFLLFYDEKLTYYITEEVNGEEIVRTPEMEISAEQEPGGQENSFAQINMILAAKDVQDDATMRKEMQHYIETAYAQKQLFTPFLR